MHFRKLSPSLPQLHRFLPWRPTSRVWRRLRGSPWRTPRRLLRDDMYYIGLDVHKKTISYCVKDAAGHVHREGKVGSTRRELDAWIPTLPQPRTIAMEATILSGWIRPRFSCSRRGVRADIRGMPRRRERACRRGEARPDTFAQTNRHLHLSLATTRRTLHSV